MASPVVEMLGVASAFPSYEYTQQEIKQFLFSHFSLSQKSKILYEKVLDHDSIQKRAFCFPSLSDVLTKDHNTLQKRFETGVVELGSKALQKCFSATGIATQSLDFVITATCTGFLCPGLSSYLIEQCGLRKDIRTFDAVGMGCGAGLPALEQAFHFVRSNPGTTAAVVCAEVCSAAFLESEAPDILISNGIFSDGAAAILLQSHSSYRTLSSSSTFLFPPKIKDFQSLTIPEWRDDLRFRKKEGYLRNVLSKDVPSKVGQAFPKLIGRILRENGKLHVDIQHWILHPGGGKILDTIEERLALPHSALDSSREILRAHGNMSSPTVFIVLEKEQELKSAKQGESAILGSFGAGFSLYAVLLEF